MTRFSTIAFLTILISCGASQSQRSQVSTFNGTRFDVDINGALVLVDAEQNIVRLMSSERKRVAEIGGSGWNDDQFDRPAGVWARNGIDIFIADYGNHRIQRFDRKLAFISSFSTRDRANPDERFGYPTDVAVSRLGDLYICDSENSRVIKVTGLSKVERAFGGFDAGKGRLKKPNQLEIGPNDNVYVQDENRVVVFDSFGNYVRTIGDGFFEKSVLIFADDAGLITISNGKIFFLDRDDRIVWTYELALMNMNTPKAFVYHRGTFQFLTDDGIITVADPREQSSRN